MAALSDFLENKLIDFLLRGQALGINGATAAAGTGPSIVYYGLLTAAGGDAGGFTEVTGAGYARVPVASTLANWAGTQGAASVAASSGTGGTTSNNTAVTFGAPTANWGSVAAVALFDSLTGGNELIYFSLTTPKTINSGDAAPAFPVSTFSFQIDN
jgi:hypothetical protein